MYIVGIQPKYLFKYILFFEHLLLTRNPAMHMKHGTQKMSSLPSGAHPSGICSASSSSKDSKPVVYATVVFFFFFFLSTLVKFYLHSSFLKISLCVVERGGEGQRNECSSRLLAEWGWEVGLHLNPDIMI